MEIVKKKSPNFIKGRAGLRPTAIVVHIGESSLGSMSNWFAQTISKVSAHYGVGKRGEVYQWVDEKDSAQHCGVVDQPTWKHIQRIPGARGRSGYVNPNLYTIGIEHEGRASDEWTDAMYQTSARLIAEIATRWSIPIDVDHIIPHRAIRASKTCPGFKVDLNRLISLAKQFQESSAS